MIKSNLKLHNSNISNKFLNDAEVECLLLLGKILFNPSIIPLSAKIYFAAFRHFKTSALFYGEQASRTAAQLLRNTALGMFGLALKIIVLTADALDVSGAAGEILIGDENI